MDSYFDKHDISFSDEGEILFGDNVAASVQEDFARYQLDKIILNDCRREYLAIHRAIFYEKQNRRADAGKVALKDNGNEKADASEKYLTKDLREKGGLSE